MMLSIQENSNVTVKNYSTEKCFTGQGCVGTDKNQRVLKVLFPTFEHISLSHGTSISCALKGKKKKKKAIKSWLLYPSSLPSPREVTCQPDRSSVPAGDTRLPKVSWGIISEGRQENIPVIEGTQLSYSREVVFQDSLSSTFIFWMQKLIFLSVFAKAKSMRMFTGAGVAARAVLGLHGGRSYGSQRP